MEKFYIQATKKMKDLLSCRDVDKWKRSLDELFKEATSLLEGKKCFLFIHKLANYSDNYIFYHIINIGFLSLCIAKKMKFNQGQLKNIFIMCLLHDRKEFGISNDLLNSLYYEHKTATEIIKIVDVFDSIMNPPPYRKLATPWVASEAIKEIVGARDDIFNSRIVEIFFRVITIYPPDSWVVLTNELVGRVKEVNRDNILKPKVEITGRIDGKKTAPFLIDLSQETALNIRDTLSESEVKKIFASNK